MPPAKYIIGGAVALVILASVLLVMRNKKPQATLPAKVTRAPRTAAPKTAAPKATVAAAATPPAQTAVDAYNMIMPPAPPPGWIVQADMPKLLLIPGASWPVVVGRDRDIVSSWLMTTYPRLVVRSVPFGSPVAYDVRTDRLTVLYDPYTRRVVSARIG